MDICVACHNPNQASSYYSYSVRARLLCLCNQCAKRRRPVTLSWAAMLCFCP